MCDNHMLIPTEPARTSALAHAALRASAAKALATSTVPAALSQTASKQELPPTPTTIESKVEAPATDDAQATESSAQLVVPGIAAPSAKASSAAVVVTESLDDVLIDAFDAKEAHARTAIIARLAVVLNLSSQANIDATRAALTSLVADGRVQAQDVAEWLSTPTADKTLKPAITAALTVLAKRTADSVKPIEINNLRSALGLKPIEITPDWKKRACGQMLVGQVYEKLKALGYTKDLPALFASGLKKYLENGR